MVARHAMIAIALSVAIAGPVTAGTLSTGALGGGDAVNCNLTNTGAKDVELVAIRFYDANLNEVIATSATDTTIAPGGSALTAIARTPGENTWCQFELGRGGKSRGIRANIQLLDSSGNLLGVLPAE